MAQTVAIILGTTGEFLGDVELVRLGAWLEANNLEAGFSTQYTVTVWPFYGDR